MSRNDYVKFANRKVFFTSKPKGTFLCVEYINAKEESRQIITAESAFRKMSALVNEGFSEVSDPWTNPKTYEYIWKP